jgi:acetyltransferase-like isoleucine patch superfamily enzyme
VAIKIENKGLNNRILVHDSVQQIGNLRVVIQGNHNLLEIGAGTRLENGLIELRNHHSMVSIGQNCLINGWLRCRSNGTRLLIGDDTTMMWVQITLHEKGMISIGQDCMLSGDVRMDVSDMHSILDAQTRKRINPPQDIEIGDHVWVGQGVHILKGSRVERDSILGAKALINGPIPANSIAVGIPAKIVKTGITWDRKLLPLEEDPGESASNRSGTGLPPRTD